MCDHGRPTGHRLHHTEPERLVEVDQVQQRSGVAQDFLAAIRPNGPQVGDAVPVDMGLDRGFEVLVILNDPGDHQRDPGPVRNFDGGSGPLVGVDPTEEDQGVSPRADLERPDINTVVNRGRVRECRMSVGVADRDVLDAIGVFEICGQGGVGRKPVDGGDHRRVDEPGVGEREEIETVVDQIEIGGTFEYRGECAAPPTSWRRVSGPRSTRWVQRPPVGPT